MDPDSIDAYRRDFKKAQHPDYKEGPTTYAQNTGAFRSDLNRAPNIQSPPRDPETGAFREG